MFGKIQNFLTEVAVELKKVSWPTRAELIEATWVVIVSTFFLTVFIWLADVILSKAVSLMIR